MLHTKYLSSVLCGFYMFPVKLYVKTSDPSGGVKFNPGAISRGSLDNATRSMHCGFRRCNSSDPMGTIPEEFHYTPIVRDIGIVVSDEMAS